MILTIENQKKALRSGLTSEVTFLFSYKSHTKKFYLPPIAVGEDSQGRYLFILQERENKSGAVVQKQKVRIGALTSEGLEIVEGIQAGQKVVTAGVSVIHDGLVVRVD